VTKHYPYFFKTDLLNTILRFGVCFVAGTPTVALMFIIPKTAPFWITLIFRNIIPTMTGTFYLFGLSKWVAYKFGFINMQSLDESDISHEYSEDDDAELL
jgi:hypothetical protein